MDSYKYIFIVLVYRNGTDLIDLFDSLQNIDCYYHVLVVNSYYDDESEKEIKSIAELYGADFINVENKGYSYGNNQGIAYAIRHYSFEYIVVCNPDVIIKRWNDESINQEGLIYGPIIKTSTGKNQNPCFVTYLPFAEKLMYLAYRYNIPLIDYIAFIAHRVIREAVLIRTSRRKDSKVKVYGVHGAFLILSSTYLQNNPAPFCEEMFLFNEERFIAWNLAKCGEAATFLTSI